MVRVRFPAAAPILHRLRVSTRPSLQNSAHSGRHGGSLPFSFGVVADKQCTCPASKVMWERYPPTPPSFAWNPSRREGFKRRMSSIGLAKEDFPRIGFQAMDGRPLHVPYIRNPKL